VIATSCGDKRNQNQQEMTDTTAVAMDTTVVVETPNIVGVVQLEMKISQHYLLLKQGL
jgi:hypothetical protein